MTDLRREAIDLLKEKAIRRGRLTEEETKVDDTILMENLHLIDEDGYLIRAAMLAFYKDPRNGLQVLILRLAILENQMPT